MRKQNPAILKDPIFLGATWIIGSLRVLIGGNLTSWKMVFFLMALVLGTALCGMALRYRPKFHRWMQAILAIQGIYYLLVTVMLILLPGDPGSKILVCIAGVGMLVLIAYAAFTVPNSTKKA